jgi:hypothetical protein
VVIAIIGVLIAVLLSAAQAPREAARYDCGWAKPFDRRSGVDPESAADPKVTRNLSAIFPALWTSVMACTWEQMNNDPVTSIWTCA